MIDLNFSMLEKVLLAFIRDSVYKNEFQNAIVGVSGGVDSAVVLALVRKALGSSHTFGLLMPYKTSSESSLEHGERICRQLDVPFETVDITPSVDGYFDRFPAMEPRLIGNKCARERMSVLYDFSEREHALVAGTSNKSEILIGYSTLYGDSAGAFFPIGDLYKTQVFQLAKYLEIPDEIVKKPPSAELWDDQTDEGEIGMTYQKLDDILFCLVEMRYPDSKIIQRGHKDKDVQKVKRMIVRSQYKRTMPSILKLQSRTVGIDFRYCRDWNR